MTRTTCSACGMQFEATGRSARCPSCGARTRARVASGTLPPLPAGLQHHSTAVTPHNEVDFRLGLASVSVLFLAAGLFIAVSAVVMSQLWLLGIAVFLILPGTGSALTTSLWHEHDQEGLRRIVAESPVILCALMFVALAGFLFVGGVVAFWVLIGSKALPFVIMAFAILLLGVFVMARAGMVSHPRLLLFRLGSKLVIWRPSHASSEEPR